MSSGQRLVRREHLSISVAARKVERRVCGQRGQQQPKTGGRRSARSSIVTRISQNS